MLKEIAIIAMTASHWDWVVESGTLSLLTDIGRAALPIFAFLIARNLTLTKSVDAYIQRLAVWGFISQPFYILAFDHGAYTLNVMFTLALGAYLVACVDRQQYIRAGLCLMVGLVCDWSIVGVVFVWAWASYLRGNPAPLLCLLAWLPVFIPVGLGLVVAYTTVIGLVVVTVVGVVESRRIPGWVYYAYYPGHLLLLTGWGVMS